MRFLKPPPEVPSFRGSFYLYSAPDHPFVRSSPENSIKNPFSDADQFVVKVGPLTSNLDGRSGNQYAGKQSPSDASKRENESGFGETSDDAGSLELTLSSQKKFDELVDSYRSDLQAQGQGLEASVEGVGPGLKVVLRDGAGSLIRQFTSQEFLRLRAASAKEIGNRGKILDQKL